MSYAECVARISQLDSLIGSLDPTWITSARSLVGTAGQGLSSASPFAEVLDSVSATTATATAATTRLGIGAGDVAAAAAIRLVGKIPYKFGASADQTAARSGADCSSFIQYIERLVGVNLSRTADAQYKDTQAQAVSRTDLRTGDLLFFGGWNDPSNPPGYAGIQHVAMYIGNGKLVQEGGSSNNVNVANVADFGSHFMYATRPGGYAVASSSTVTTSANAIWPDLNTLRFVSPLARSAMTQAFGPTGETLEPPATVNGVTYLHYHNGIDLAAPLGSSVMAAGSGQVTFAGRLTEGGAVVVKIRHDDGYVTWYAHLDPSLQVAVGQRVTAGQTIGRIGMTGVTTGPHLHFGLYNSAGTAVDPAPWAAAGHLPDPAVLLGPRAGDSGALSQTSGTAALARFDAASSRIPYHAEIRAVAIANGVDPTLLAALVYAESSFNPRSVSSCGAMGLTQLMPNTARGLDVTDPFDVQQNLNGGAKYLVAQLRKFGRVDMALAAYNAGPGLVSNLGVVPNGCWGYVNTILRKWQSYQVS
jgi:murein DD-endopeptidase MepM/ murein hydrolase activator NlpD